MQFDMVQADKPEQGENDENDISRDSSKITVRYINYGAVLDSKTNL